MKAAVYCRVSTEEQRDRQTIELQRDHARKYCDLHQIPVVDYFLDEGISGTIPLHERPEGRRLIAAAKNKAFDTVLVYRLDRLGRDPRLNLNTVNELDTLGIVVKSMTEAFDVSTPEGRFMLATLSSVAGLERETILQRMREGTERAVREGAWRGVVPYGYRRVGERRHARLEIAEDPLPGLSLSEADVVRMIFRMSADERKSCSDIAIHLNRLGIPPACQIPGHNGKRMRNTAGVWYPGRALRILRSTTYRGLHTYGKRSTKKRDLVERPVPAIVSEELWNRAQETLLRNQVWSPRNGKRDYLLRGLMKCGICGFALCGSSNHTPNRYYICSAKRFNKDPMGNNKGRCPSRPVPATLEDTVWSDLEAFLRNPGPVIEEVAESLDDMRSQVDRLRKDAAAAERALVSKDQERERVLALYRRGGIDDATLDQQLEAIQRERAGLTEALKDAQERLRGVEDASSHVRSAEALLARLNARLDAPLTFALKREIVEELVDAIRIDTIPENGRRKLLASVTYRFSPPDPEFSFAMRTNKGWQRLPRQTGPGTPRRRPRGPE